MNKSITIVIEIKISDVENLNVQELISIAGQQGTATLVDFRIDEEKKY
jgi:galactokinase